MRINWSPTPVEELEQCVRALLATAPGTVPLSRQLGTPQDVLDTPASLAGARLRADVAAALRAWEPRVKVKRIPLSTTADGKLVATVEIEPNG